MVDPKSLSYFYALLILGTLESLKKGVLTIEKAEKSVFSPFTLNLLKDNGANSAVIGLISKGLELADILEHVSESSYEEEIGMLIDECCTYLRIDDSLEQVDDSRWILSLINNPKS